MFVYDMHRVQSSLGLVLLLAFNFVLALGLASQAQGFSDCDTESYAFSPRPQNGQSAAEAFPQRVRNTCSIGYMSSRLMVLSAGHQSNPNTGGGTFFFS